MTMTRKQFLRSLAGMGIGAVGASVLVACGGDSKASVDAPGGGASCLSNGTSAMIGSNHGHVLVVSKADVAAGVDKTYDIMGTATHSHMVTVTAALFAKLATNMSIMATSTVAAAHMHDITVMCV